MDAFFYDIDILNKYLICLIYSITFQYNLYTFTPVMPVPETVILKTMIIGSYSGIMNKQCQVIMRNDHNQHGERDKKDSEQQDTKVK